LNYASTPSYVCTLWRLITPRDNFSSIFDFILSNLFVKAILMGSSSASLPVEPSLCSQYVLNYCLAVSLFVQCSRYHVAAPTERMPSV
jgi:hypothetical protein